MKVGNIMTIEMRKYRYTLKRIERKDEKVGGCYGCFFCKRKYGYMRQTCGDCKDKIGDCGKTILESISKERK